MKRHGLSDRWAKKLRKPFRPQLLMGVVLTLLEGQSSIGMHHMADIVKKTRQDKRMRGTLLLGERSSLKGVCALGDILTIRDVPCLLKQLLNGGRNGPNLLIHEGRIYREHVTVVQLRA